MSAGIDYFEIARPGKRRYLQLLPAGFGMPQLVDQAAGKARPNDVADFPVELDRVTAAEENLRCFVLACGEDDVGRIDQSVSELKKIHNKNDGRPGRFCASKSKLPGRETSGIWLSS